MIMLCYITHDMLYNRWLCYVIKDICYITHPMLCYITHDYVIKHMICYVI